MKEIDAINLMLSIINEQPINTLNEGYIEADLAYRILKEVSVEIQSVGWWFNREEDFDLLPDFNNNINLEENVLSVDPVSNTDEYVQRGRRLYDRGNKTYTITDKVSVNMIIELDFEDLPHVAQHYIVVRAGRKFQSRILGSETLYSYTDREEQEAKLRLVTEETENGDYNLLDNSNLLSIYS